MKTTCPRAEKQSKEWRRVQLDEPLPRDPDALQKLVYELVDKINAMVDRGLTLETQLALALQRLHGRRSERVEDPRQQQLFAMPKTSEEQAVSEAGEGEEEAEEEPLERPESSRPKPRKRRNGRRPLPKTLPRIQKRLELDPDERLCRCCNEPMAEIGEEITEQLEHVPSKFFVFRFVRPKYACRKCQDGLLTAEPPAAPITKGLAGPGVLAHIATSKYCDHLPLHRQEAIFARHGVELRRSTLADWIGRCAQLLEPLYDRLKAEVLSGRRVHLDDTKVNVQRDSEGKRKKKRKQGAAKTRHWELKRGYLWAYVGDDEHPFIVYDYTKTRSRHGPLEFLRGFRGFVQADDYRGHRELFRNGTRKHVACWAHARRKFYGADATDSARARHAIDMIRRRYEIERENRDLPETRRLAARREKAKPLLEEFKAWLEAQRRQVLPKSPIGNAIAYTLGLWPELERYTEYGFLEIDNNAAERAIKHLVIGRKNWLFAGSDRGARHSAILFSVIASCKRNGKEPYAYLRDLFTILPRYRGDIEALLPDRYEPKPVIDPLQR